ncbi:hypothetical protein BJX62DRAFT_240102 [Aspergillus germanicus]
MDSTDSTWVSARLALYSIPEINIGIIVACVCTFPKFIQRMRELRVVDRVRRALLGRRDSRARGRQGSLDSILPLRWRDRQPVGINLGSTMSGSSKTGVHLEEIVYGLDGVDSRVEMLHSVPYDFS